MLNTILHAIKKYSTSLCMVKKKFSLKVLLFYFIGLSYLVLFVFYVKQTNPMKMCIRDSAYTVLLNPYIYIYNYL